MRVHLDVLAWLHGIWGALGILAGMSLWVLGVGTDAALLDLGSVSGSDHAAMWMFLATGAVLVAFGLLMLLIGRWLFRRRGAGRVAALACAVPNLVIVPFGTALGVYTIWALLNDDARRDFGHPPHRPAPPHPTLESV